MHLLKAAEAALTVDNPDALFEAYLSALLDMVPACKAEILLFSSRETLLPVAFATWDGPGGDRRKRIQSESWVLENPANTIGHRIRYTPMRPFFSIPLLDAAGILGFLNIQLDKLEIVAQGQLEQFNLMGLQIAAKLKEIRLKGQMRHLEDELRDMARHNKEIHQYATELSKELYAISAISTKINQSMDFEKSLRKSMDTTRKVFGAAVILVYIESMDTSRMELVAVVPEAASALALSAEQVKQIEKKCLKEILRSSKPVVKDRVAAYFRPVSPTRPGLGFASLIGVPLKSKEAVQGAMILLHKHPKPINHAGIRLLSGMANIMGMAIENMALYRQSEQKKSEAAFLFRSIVKFNETLNLKAILTSVAEKGAEYCGLGSCVYLVSRGKTATILATNRAGPDNGKGNRIRFEESVRPEIDRIYHLILSEWKNGSVLIRRINYAKKIPPAVKPVFRGLDIFSLVAVPLRVRHKQLGLLLLTRGRQAEPFNKHHHAFAKALASAAILAIENARAYTASQEMSDFLEKKITEKTTLIQHIQARQLARVENRNDMVFQVNRHNRFVFANKAMEDLTGLSRETLCHKDFSSNRVVAPEDRERIAACFSRIMNREVSLLRDIEYRQLNRRGEDHIIALTIYPEIDHTGRVVGVEGVGRDVTEKKRLERELKKARELAMLGEFSGAIAHQIRNPLGNILMGAKRLQRDLGLDDRPSADTPRTGRRVDRLALRDILADVFAGVYNLNQVVTELLEYTKNLKLSLSLQRIDLVLKETCQAYAAMIRQNGISVSEQYNGQVPRIPMDAVLFGQAVENVIHNAIQAMPRGGHLTLTTGFYRKRPADVMISVSDSGPGIDAADTERIFRPFYTTKEDGTGLGLSLTHRIIEAHGGNVWACRNPCGHLEPGAAGVPSTGRAHAAGTTIHMLLPLHPDGFPASARCAQPNDKQD